MGDSLESVSEDDFSLSEPVGVRGEFPDGLIQVISDLKFDEFLSLVLDHNLI